MSPLSTDMIHRIFKGFSTLYHLMFWQLWVSFIDNHTSSWIYSSFLFDCRISRHVVTWPTNTTLLGVHLHIMILLLSQLIFIVAQHVIQTTKLLASWSESYYNYLQTVSVTEPKVMLTLNNMHVNYAANKIFKIAFEVLEQTRIL